MELLILIIISIFLFYTGWSLASFKEASSPNGFFKCKDQTRSIFSITFGGVTLGTGFAYTSDLGAQLGLWAFVTGLGIFTGYLLLSLAERKIAQGKINYITENFAKTFENSNSWSIISLYNVFRVLVFSGLISFEIWLSTIYIGSIFGVESSSPIILGLAMALGLFAFCYTAIGGLPAALKTDIVQGISVIILLVMLSLIGFSSLSGSDFGVFDTLYEATPALDFTTGILLAGTFIGALATQFYGIVNFTAPRRRSAAENSKSFLISGFAQTFIIFLIIFIGLTFTQNDDLKSIQEFFINQSELDSFIKTLILSIGLIGLTSILFTTIDTLIVALTQTTASVLKFDTDEKEIRIWPRIIASIYSVVIIPASLFLIMNDYNLIGYILTILSPLACISSFFISKIFLDPSFFENVHEKKIYDYRGDVFWVALFSISILLIGVLGPFIFSFDIAPMLSIAALLPSISVIVFSMFRSRSDQGSS